MTYLGWFDDGKKRTTAERIDAAARRYEHKHGIAPTVALVNPEDAIGVTAPLGIEIRPTSYVARNTVYVGRDA
ncbi:MAG TPA: hypothetical protein PLR44_14260 [Thermomicrobiales bacterium]|nr:hypothetical protein [Chloroflexota bacterium]HQZ91212.1 hypothetical protein [Thermomicrobiales bacterium]HRA32899.1 hypothetical protein [Thermomicrobiales bacterium]